MQKLWILSSHPSFSGVGFIVEREISDLVQSLFNSSSVQRSVINLLGRVGTVGKDLLCNFVERNSGMRGHLACSLVVLGPLLMGGSGINFGHKPWPENEVRPSRILSAVPSAPPPASWSWNNVDGVNYLTQVLYKLSKANFKPVFRIRISRILSGLFAAHGPQLEIL